ncbi:MAG: polysaccharide deacetylase family protein [Bacteroidota bacterium]
MILIYSPQLSPRIRYIFKLIIGGLLKDEVVFTTDKAELSSHEGPKINYSSDPDTEDALFFQAEGLLSEKEIGNKALSMIEGEAIPAFFPVGKPASSLNFDPFAASFYLVSRYEEYLPYVRDEYGRFQAKESFAWKNGFLDKPVVNMWADLIAAKITQKWPSWKPGEKSYHFIPTIDINAAWMYKRKGFFRTFAAIGDKLANGHFGEVLDRIKVVAGKNADPFDTYTDQLGLHKEFGLETIYFILFADYDNNDRNIPVHNRHFKVLIKGLSDYCKIGIHTSYASIKSPEKLNGEFKRLAAVLNKDVTMTRQHFHVLDMPWTYRHLVSMDVEDDFSMGYAVTPGFRAGICDPFYFYDLDLEMETNLKIWPYAIVDKGLEYGYDLETSFKQIIDRVKSVRGTLITLWNNESLVIDSHDKLKLRTYEEMIKMALE